MQHHEIINTLSGGRYVDYLEIGVLAGLTFNQVEIANKVAVDPGFRIAIEKLQGDAHPITSDAFFSKDNRQFDCIFIDGLHVYEQVRRDFMNAWGRIKPDGIVLIDDCIPSDNLAALRDHAECLKLKAERGDRDRNWMGDVYKLAVWIHDFTDYCFCHVQGSVGVLAVWNQREQRHPLIGDERQIADLSFEDFRKLPLPVASVETIKARMSIAKSQLGSYSLPHR